VLLRNMATVLGMSPRDPRVRFLALKSLRNYCKYLIEFLELPMRSSSDADIASMKIHGLQHLQEALAAGKGVILASAHFGTIEIGGLRLSDFTTVHAVYDSFRPAYLDRLIQRKRLEKGIHLIPTSDVRGMLRALKSGGTLTLLFDRPVPREKGVGVRFFGRDTAVPGGPAVLSIKTGAPIVPAYMLRQPDRTFECILYPAITGLERGERERDVRIIMQKLMDTLQSTVLSRPDQWYMFRPMWPEDQQAPRRPSRVGAAAGGPAV
jgi:lauroyl/myristoyl acyltransferase